MDQDFTGKQLLKFASKVEIEEYPGKKAALSIALDDIHLQISSGNFSFDIHKNANHFYITELSQKLVLRKLNDNLKRLYKEEQSNRRMIVSQVKTLLEETTPMYILRTDIASFYKSINKKRILQKLYDDSMLSYHSLILIDKIFSNSSLANEIGLPWGLNISSTLSEIYMRNFDKWVKRYRGVFFYARFVDDIIVFAISKEIINNVNDNLESHLEEGLLKRKDKTQIVNGLDLKHNSYLEYLGFKFETKTQKILNDKNVYVKRKFLSVSIAQKKINKIKSRIVYSLMAYIKDKDFVLLENRMKFLTGNYSIKYSGNGQTLKAGIYYNYYLVNDLRVFDDLNLFYRKMLFSNKGSFGNKISNSLTIEQKEYLLKYCFKFGFRSKIFIKLSPNDINKIKSVWK